MNGNVKAAQTALNELIKVAGNCEDREKLEKTAADIFEKYLQGKPALIKRACEAFNSNKAVCLLSKRSDSDRGEDFAILSAPNVIARIDNHASQTALKKAASFKPLFYSNEQPAEAVKMQKVASTFDPVAEIKLNINPEILELGIIGQLDRHEDTINKLAFGIEHAKYHTAQAFENVSRMASHMSKQAKADTLAVCSAHYASMMTNELANLFATDLPLRKFAAAPQLPDNDICSAINDYMGCKMVEGCREAMLKEASAITVDLLRKLAGAYTLQKKASVLSAGAAQLLRSPGFNKTLGLSDDGTAELLDQTITPNLRNVLSELELKRSFFDILNDDYISTFPIEQVQEAFNAAMQKLPPNARQTPSLHTAVLRGWVSKYLSHGGTASAEDTEDVLKASRYLSGRTLKQRIEEADDEL